MKHPFFLALMIATTMLCALMPSCIKTTDPEPVPPVDYPWTIKYDSLGLPLPTQEGKNIVGFLLNDSVWLPGCGSLLTPELRAIYSDDAQLNVLNRCNPIDRQLHIGIVQPTRVGVFALSDNLLEGFDAYYIDYNPDEPNVSRKSYICSQKGASRCKYTVDFYDPTRRIRSGTFEMVMYRVIPNSTPSHTPLNERDQYLNLNDSIVIRSGRYDVVGYY